MNDGLNRKISIGDRVRLWGETYGDVVYSFEDREFMQDDPATVWGHLREGVLIRADLGDIFHYDEPDEDVELVGTHAGR